MNNLKKLSSFVYGKVVDFHHLFFFCIILFFLLACFSLWMNIAGKLYINIFIGMVLSFGVGWFATHPKHVFYIAGLGIVDDPWHPIEETEEILDWFGRVVSHFLAYTSVFFLIMGTMPIGRNYFSFFVLIFAIWTIAWLSLVFGSKRVLYKKVLVTYTYIILILSLLALPPSSLWMKVVGSDPFDFLRISETEKIVYDIQETQKEQKAEEIQQKLRSIRKKVEAGSQLNQKDKEFLRRWKSKVKDKSLLQSFKNKVSETGSAIASKFEGEEQVKKKPAYIYPTQDFTLKAGESFTTPSPKKKTTLRMIIAGGSESRVKVDFIPDKTGATCKPGVEKLTLARGEKAVFTGIGTDPVKIKLLD